MKGPGLFILVDAIYIYTYGGLVEACVQQKCTQLELNDDESNFLMCHSVILFVNGLFCLYPFLILNQIKECSKKKPPASVTRASRRLARTHRKLKASNEASNINKKKAFESARRSYRKTVRSTRLRQSIARDRKVDSKINACQSYVKSSTFYICGRIHDIFPHFFFWKYIYSST